MITISLYDMCDPLVLYAIEHLKNDHIMDGKKMSRA